MPPSFAGLTVRDVANTTAGSELNGTNITLIFFVAIVPVLVVAAAVSWLLCCYSRGRGCGRRKKGDETAATPASSTPAPAVQGTTMTQAPGGWTPPMQQNAPTQPAPVHMRNDSMMSKKSKSSTSSSIEKAPTLPEGFV